MPTRHLLALSAALAMVPGAARAHHSFAAFFDPDKSVSITTGSDSRALFRLLSLGRATATRAGNNRGVDSHSATSMHQ